VTLVGQDLRGAQRAAFSYVREVFELPVFRSLVARETADTIELTNGITVAEYPCRSSAVRGVRNLSAFMDEDAHFVTTEGRAVDVEMYRSLMPTLLTTNGRLVIATSPYSMSGLVWEMFRKHWARADSDVLVWRGSISEMNPGLDTVALQRLRAEDPEGADSEVEGRFRRGLSMLLDAEALDAVTDSGVNERLPQAGVTYRAHFDASGGRSDAAALAVAHRDKDSVVLDCLRRWPAPHSPEIVITEAADVVRSFSLTRVQIDRFGGEFPVSAFERHRVRAEVARRTTNEHYLALLPVVNAGKVRLLDRPDFLRELRGLERRRGTSGKDTVTHPRTGHDDAAAAVAGVVTILAGSRDPEDRGITFGTGVSF
jgi:hypothetical protein